MNIKRRDIKAKKAFSVVEVLIDIAIFSAIAAAVLTAYSASSKAMDLAKAKIAAVALANEKMETIRNMPYNSLATKNGVIYPPGNILDDEEVERKGIRFSINTVIRYVDDDYDGNVKGDVPGKPVDIYPYDYKKVEITVSKIGRKSYLSRLTSNIAAKAAETPSDSGILRLCVVDALGQPVPEAQVTIENSEVTPAVNMSATTGNDGCIMVPNLPPTNHNSYHLTATKANYSTDMTYPRTAQNPNALFPDIDILLQQVTNQTLIIDQIGTLVIDVVDKDNNPIPNAPVHVEGAKEKYFNPSTRKYVADFTADANGHLEIPNLEFDNYTISVNGKFVSSASPYQPVYLSPNTTLNLKIFVTDSASDPRIEGAVPSSGKIGDIVYLTIKGANFDNGAIVKIVNPATGAEIVGTNTNRPHLDTLETEINLAGTSEQGLWNIVVTNPDNTTVTQINGFEVKL